MTKEKYMNTLRDRLNQLNIEGREDILNDFEAHFTLGKQNGHSDEELMESLGSIEEILESYENLQSPNDEKILIDGHDQKKEFTNKITTIDISARHADTKITTSKDNGFHVDLYKEGRFLERMSHALIAYQEEDVFYVKVLPLFPHKSSGQYDLSIQVPHDLPNLILNTSSGDAYLRTSQFKKLESTQPVVILDLWASTPNALVSKLPHQTLNSIMCAETCTFDLHQAIFRLNNPME